MQRLCQPRSYSLPSRALNGPTAAQWAAFWALGDVNMDGYINQKDLDIMQAAWASNAGAPDINNDGVVNILDVNICAQNQGLNIWELNGYPTPGMDLSVLIPVAIGMGIGVVIGFAIGRR